MNDPRTFRLVHAQARQGAANACMAAPEGWVVEIKEPKRNLDQNALLHSVLGEIADQVKWHGKTLSIDIWKRLCTASWLRENGDHPMLIPSLDGNGFDVIFEKTSKLNLTQCSSLIEWCFAFGAEQNVIFRAVERY
jgi:hypothetical protein